MYIPEVEENVIVIHFVKWFLLLRVMISWFRNVPWCSKFIFHFSKNVATFARI